jgi:hypothetical protein
VRGAVAHYFFPRRTSAVAQPAEELSMSNADRELITKLAEVLTRQNYSRVVVANYCRYAQAFLEYLAKRELLAATVTPREVAQYLGHAIRSFRKRYGRPPGRAW